LLLAGRPGRIRYSNRAGFSAGRSRTRPWARISDGHFRSRRHGGSVIAPTPAQGSMRSDSSGNGGAGGFALSAVACLAVAIAGDAMAHNLKPFSVDDLVSLRQVSDPRVSPDGRYVAFTVRHNDLRTDRTLAGVWILNLD